MTAPQLLALFLSLGLALLLTPVTMLIARRWGAIDDPSTAPDRKRHTKPIPLLGGLAVIVSSWITWGALYQQHYFTGIDLPTKYILSLILAGALIGIGGALDDRYRLTAQQQIWWTIAAVTIVVAAGIGVKFITNPLGGIIDLTAIQWTIFRWHGLPYQLTLWADVFTIIWLLGASYTTKILDGLDGLVTGLGVLGSLIVFLLTLRPEVNQPGVGLLALSLVGALTGFLFWNWHPAKVFLGESGSLYIGFMLGILSIISGGKIATALLILGLPIIDLLWVIIQRLRNHRSPFTSADRFHLHFRLLDAGLSVRQSVTTILTLVTLFGFSTLYVSGRQKVEVLGALLLVMILLVWWVMRRIADRRMKGIQI